MPFNQKIKHLCTIEGISHKHIVSVERGLKIFIQREQYRIKYKPNHKSNDYFDCTGYTDGSAFSIIKVENDKCWSIAHIPSESILFCGIKRKRDAETIMFKFKELSGENYDNLWMYAPDVSLLSEEMWKLLDSAKEYFLYTRSFKFRFGSAR